MIEHHDSVAILESATDVAPHVLIAAETVCENQGLRARVPVLPDIVPTNG